MSATSAVPRFWIRFSCCALAVSSCAEGSDDLPLGDDLTSLLDLVADTSVYDSAMSRCLSVAEASADEYNAYQTSVGRVNGELASRDASVVWGYYNPPDIDDPVDDLSDALSTALADDILIDGSRYKGCADYASHVLSETPAEVARVGLQDAYSEDVLSRLAADPRRRELDLEWASCMNRRGFPVPPRMGGHIDLIYDKAQSTGGDPSLYEDARAFENSVSAANLECLDEGESLKRLDSIVLEYDRRFVEEYRTGIENLILLTREARSE